MGGGLGEVVDVLRVVDGEGYLAPVGQRTEPPNLSPGHYGAGDEDIGEAGVDKMLGLPYRVDGNTSDGAFGGQL